MERLTSFKDFKNKKRIQESKEDTNSKWVDINFELESDEGAILDGDELKNIIHNSFSNSNGDFDIFLASIGQNFDFSEDDQDKLWEWFKKQNLIQTPNNTPTKPKFPIYTTVFINNSEFKNEKGITVSSKNKQDEIKVFVERPKKEILVPIKYLSLEEIKGDNNQHYSFNESSDKPIQTGRGNTSLEDQFKYALKKGGGTTTDAINELVELLGRSYEDIISELLEKGVLSKDDDAVVDMVGESAECCTDEEFMDAVDSGDKSAIDAYNKAEAEASQSVADEMGISVEELDKFLNEKGSDIAIEEIVARTFKLAKQYWNNSTNESSKYKPLGKVHTFPERIKNLENYGFKRNDIILAYDNGFKEHESILRYKETDNEGNTDWIDTHKPSVFSNRYVFILTLANTEKDKEFDSMKDLLDYWKKNSSFKKMNSSSESKLNLPNTYDEFQEKVEDGIIDLIEFWEKLYVKGIVNQEWNEFIEEYGEDARWGALELIDNRWDEIKSAVNEAKEEGSEEKTDEELFLEILNDRDFVSKKEEDTQLMTELLDVLVDPSVTDGVKQLVLDKCKEYLTLEFDSEDIDECYEKIKESFSGKQWCDDTKIVEHCQEDILTLASKIMNNGASEAEINDVCTKINSGSYDQDSKNILCKLLHQLNEVAFIDYEKAIDIYNEIEQMSMIIHNQ